ncbi:MAG: response regulator transcription factor [Bacteroidota bacterium]
MKIVNVILAEDTQMFREGVAALLKYEEGVNVIAHATNGLEVVDLVDQHKHEVDVVIMDLEMPGQTGLEATAAIYEKYPSQDIGIVILTNHKAKVYVKRALRLGVRSYIFKDDSANELVLAVREVATGREYYGQDVMKMLPEIIREEQKPKPKISKRELEIIRVLAKGITSDEIGVNLQIAPNTVHTHLRNIRKKLGARNSQELLMKAVQIGLIDPSLGTD